MTDDDVAEIAELEKSALQFRGRKIFHDEMQNKLAVYFVARIMVSV
mgnify:CR=1 FL=1